MPEIAWVLVAVLVVSIVGGVLAVRWEARHPSSYTRPPVGTPRADYEALREGELREQGRLRGMWEWRAWSPDVTAGASEAAGARAVEEAARINALHHP